MVDFNGVAGNRQAKKPTSYPKRFSAGGGNPFLIGFQRGPNGDFVFAIFENEVIADLCPRCAHALSVAAGRTQPVRVEDGEREART